MALTEREIIQHQLSIIHAHSGKEEVKYLATIKANVKMKWQSTKTFIEDVRRRNEASCKS
jgi:hypothetical protein